MTFIGLFILTASLVASMWAGKVELLEAALIFFAATVIADLLATLALWVTKSTAAKAAQLLMASAKTNPIVADLVNKGIEQAARNANKKE